MNHVRSLICLCLTGCLCSLAYSQTTATQASSGITPESIVAAISSQMPTGLKPPQAPKSVNTRGMTEFQAQEASKKDSEASDAYQLARKELPAKYKAIVNKAKEPFIDQAVTWCLEVMDISSETTPAGMIAITLRSDRGYRVMAVLGSDQKVAVSKINKGQIVEISGRIKDCPVGDLRNVPDFMVSNEGLEWERFSLERLCIVVEAATIRPAKVGVMFVVDMNGMVRDSASSAASRIIKGLTEQDFFSVIMVTSKPPSPLKDKLIPATDANKKDALDPLGVLYIYFEHNHVMPSILQGFNAIKNDIRQKRYLHVMTGELSANEWKQLVNLLPSRRAGIKAVIWIKDAKRIPPDVKKAVESSGGWIRTYGRDNWVL